MPSMRRTSWQGRVSAARSCAAGNMVSGVPAMSAWSTYAGSTRPGQTDSGSALTTAPSTSDISRSQEFPIFGRGRVKRPWMISWPEYAAHIKTSPSSGSRATFMQRMKSCHCSSRRQWRYQLRSTSCTHGAALDVTAIGWDQSRRPWKTRSGTRVRFFDAISRS
jgi:hypothetical protein